MDTPEVTNAAAALSLLDLRREMFIRQLFKLAKIGRGFFVEIFPATFATELDLLALVNKGYNITVAPQRII